jgi:predicted ester cyclase
MIDGIHAIVFSPAADQVRAFFRDTVDLPNVDAGGGWLIFAVPPAELAVHAADRASHELYLMTGDLDATVAALAVRGVVLARPIADQTWGRVTAIALPDGAEIGLYEPRHARPPAPQADPAAPSRPTPEEENRDLVRAYYEAVYDRRELDRLEVFLAPDFVSAGPGGRMERDAHATALAASLAAMPDLRLTIEEQIAAGDAVVTRWSATGTQRGPLFGISPTDRAVSATAIHIHHLRGGLIVDQWEQFDTLGVLGQLGLVPRPA